ncbi:MAG: zinc-ribbon domain containing protein [Dehalococcoidales bacterium]|nr:zinc-ribbon domain containing protein [Dehalococcoidales bacterium]
MTFEDKTLTCSDCAKTFTFGVEEQEQFQTRGYTNEPKRCPECRQARKTERFASGGGDTARTGSYGYDSPRREMFPAVCSQCGKQTTVPFEPRQGRPVYCSDCYRKVKVTR